MKEQGSSRAKPGPGKPWRFPSDRGRMPCPAAEGLVGHIDVQIEQPVGPAERMIDVEFFETMEVLCESKGCVIEVDEEYFEIFLSLNENEMRATLRALFFGFRTWINRICRNLTLDDLEDDMRLRCLIEPLLYLLARGTIAFDANCQATFCKPKGPRPSPEVQQRILDRITAEHKLQIDVLKWCFSVDFDTSSLPD